MDKDNNLIILRLIEETRNIKSLYESYEREMKVSIKGIFDAKVLIKTLSPCNL